MVLLEIITLDPYLYLDEIAGRLNSHPHVAPTTYTSDQIYRQFALDGYSLKKMRRFAAERDEAQRAQFWAEIHRVVLYPWQLLFIDETAKDGRTLRRANGWSRKGTRIERRETLLRGRRISVLGVFSYTGFIDHHWVDGGYSGEQFIDAVQYHVIPHLQPWPQPNSILVLDNCPMHYSYEGLLRAMVHRRGALLLFLAPYCFIDSPIEPAFHNFKAWLRRNSDWADANPEGEVLRVALRDCMGPSEAAGFYAGCGYSVHPDARV